MEQSNEEVPVPVNDEVELLACIAEAAAKGQPLEVTGNGTRRHIGRPVDAGRRLDLSGMAGITLYEPDELVLTAKAGTPLETIRRELDNAGQMLAFDPMTGKEGDAGGAGTIGGVLATNLSGPRRLTAGAARDYLLGFKAVSGRGEAFQSGSRVMKNVTGYDLSKLMAGSYGTLAVMHEVTLKTLPKPETAASLLYNASNATEGRKIIEAAFASPHEPSAAAIIPAATATYSALGKLQDFAASGVIVAIRIEGFEVSVKARSKALSEMGGRPPMVSNGDFSDSLQAEIRETGLLQRHANRVIWRISCPPAAGGALLDLLLDRPNTRGYADWGGALIWLVTHAGQQAGAESIRELVDGHGGEAMLYEAEEGLRRSLPVFHPQPEPVAALTRKIKSGFDPLGILNPGRMIEGV